MHTFELADLAQRYNTLSTIHTQLYKPRNNEVLTHYCLLNYYCGAIYYFKIDVFLKIKFIIMNNLNNYFKCLSVPLF